MNIILLGYRGSGKTSIGKKLAIQLWREFFDVDAEACKRLGNDSIAAIWEELGEPRWREVEVEVTRDLCARDNLVIGLGGGTLMQAGAREAVEQADARRVYLKCSPEELLRRAESDPISVLTRPNLTGLGGGIEEIHAMLAQREPVYEAVADFTLNVTRMDVPTAVRFIIEKCM